MVFMARLDKIITHLNDPTEADIKLVTKAYELAKSAHTNQPNTPNLSLIHISEPTRPY